MGLYAVSDLPRNGKRPSFASFCLLHFSLSDCENGAFSAGSCGLSNWACLSPCASACDEALSKLSCCPCLHPPQALLSLGWPCPSPCSPRAGLVCYLQCWQKQKVLKVLVCSLNWCSIACHHFPLHLHPHFPSLLHRHLYLTLACAWGTGKWQVSRAQIQQQKTWLSVAANSCRRSSRQLELATFDFNRGRKSTLSSV